MLISNQAMAQKTPKDQQGIEIHLKETWSHDMLITLSNQASTFP
jgi:hypothetical protein